MSFTEWKELKAFQAEAYFNEYCNTRNISCESDYEEIKSKLNEIFNDALEELQINDSQIQSYKYSLDLRFGLKLYEVLNSYGMTMRYAATDGIWRYLSVATVPNLVEKRYGIDHPDRFWKKPKRIWLRVLWWYIHLSWQGSIEDTYKILKNNTTDEILQLVDRCGQGGFRVSLCRELMKKNYQIHNDPIFKEMNLRRDNQLFRKVLVLNTARVQSIEPDLVNGGNSVYVDNLYNYFLKEK